MEKTAIKQQDPPAATTPVRIDITADVCPMTFVRTRLALDRLSTGQHLLVHLKGHEPRTNIPRSATGLGHTVVSLLDQPDGTTLLLLRHK